MIDTCQANTMYSKLYSPNILATGSSELYESSYSHHADTDIGVAVIDRYTYYNLEFLEKNVDITSQATMKDLFDSYDRNLIHSTPGVRTDLFRRNIDQVKITDFFGNVQSVEVGGQGQVIEEALLTGEEEEKSDGAAGVNETVVPRGRGGVDTLEVGSHGFEVKLQDGHVWVKVSALLACIILWISSKRF